MVTILGRVAAALGLVTVIAVPGAAAQFESSTLTEEEAAGYTAMLFSGLGDCNVEWLSGQFLPGAVIRFTHADGRLETAPPSDEAALARYCRPYKYIKWDRRSTQRSSAGSATIIRWSMTWGGYEQHQDGHSKVEFDNWVDVVKYGQQLRVADAGWTAYDLEPGGEEEFTVKASEGIVGYKLRQWFAFLKSSYGTLKHRLREWSQKRRKTTATE